MYYSKVTAWEPIEGYKGYQVSTDGQVRRWLKTRQEYRYLRPGANADGHLRLKLAGKEVYVHTLVLEAFVCARPNGLEALHLNDIKSDNQLHNLSWGTHSQNIRQAYVNGLRAKNRQLTAEIVREMRQEALSGQNHCQIARRWGYNRCTIRDAVTRRSWAFVV